MQNRESKTGVGTADLATVERFVTLAGRGLTSMFNPQHQLFCYKLKRTEQGMVQEGLSPRYTMMTLMGLHRLAEAGLECAFDKERILDSLLSDLTWADNIGDLGVLLWMCGIVCPERFATIEKRVAVHTALARHQDARHGMTMHLAWFLTGLSYWMLQCPDKRSDLEGLANQTYAKLRANQGAAGFFGHFSTTGSLAGMIRGRIGSFADQVYPIYGMAQFSRACENREAAERSLRCARGICDVQGSSGQWWWHYDSAVGRVADGYPVFSVHQHAMAPMTLFGLGDVIGDSFDEWIYRGLRWINSNNELKIDMESSADHVIWRCIERKRRSVGRYLKVALGGSPKVEEEAANLKVLYECRPYELGWLLYAFAGRRKQSPSSTRTEPQVQVVGN